MTLSAAFQQPGETIKLTAPYDRLGGQGAKVGLAFGVAAHDVLSGVDAAFLTEGVFSLAKTSAQSWTQGDRIYWDDTNKRCDNVGTVGMLIGYATAAAANPSATGLVNLEAPTARAAAVASLTDSSGGAAANGTIEAVTDVATAANGIKELATKLNELLAALRAVGMIS